MGSLRVVECSGRERRGDRVHSRLELHSRLQSRPQERAGDTVFEPWKLYTKIVTEKEIDKEGEEEQSVRGTNYCGVVNSNIGLRKHAIV